MTPLRCPQDIFDLFDRDPGLARTKALEWLKEVSASAPVGSEFIVPNPETGEEMGLTKEEPRSPMSLPLRPADPLGKKTANETNAPRARAFQPENGRWWCGACGQWHEASTLVCAGGRDVS